MDDIETLKTENTALRSDRIRESVKVHALQNGLLDPSDLDKCSLDGLTLEADGTIKGMTEFIGALKSSKPHYFKPDNSSAGPDRTLRQIPKQADVSAIKPGSPEHKKLQREYMERWSG